MKKKKLLFLIHDLGHGGAEKVLVNLVNNLNKNIFDITVVSLFAGGINEQFLDKRINYQTIFKKVFPANSRIMKLFSPEFLHKLFIKEKYDIEISFLEGPSTRIISGCDNPNTKLIHWIHCTMNNEKDFCIGYRNIKEAINCYEKFDKTICVSNGVRESFAKYLNINSVDVLYNINETDLLIDKSKEQLDENIIDNNITSLCSVGRLITVKGFDRFIKIHKRLIDEGYKINSYILGEGDCKENLQKEICTQNIQDTFKLLGYHTNPYKYVSKCDLFVCTSYSEGFSTAATEALIVGTPVCTVEVSGMKEMLGKNNEYGIVVDNDDEALFNAIKELLDNPQLLAYYKEKTIERGKYFSKEKTVKAVEDMLMSL